MHLRFRHSLGFETLYAEVTDSLSSRPFCRIGPYDKVPDPSSLMKIAPLRRASGCGASRSTVVFQGEITRPKY
jgi:hypothetical protein